MLVYREASSPCRPRAELQAVVDRALGLASRGGTGDDWLEVLIDAGELHAACADALAPEQDDLDPSQAALGDLLRTIAAAWLRARHGRRARGTAAHVVAAWSRCSELPVAAERRVPEGFAYYALSPETLVAAVSAVARKRAPPDAVVIGIRSIGSTLGAVAAETLAQSSVSTWAWTVRPRGHPFARRVRVGPALESALTARRSALHFVVDEGPGLSGSSIAAVADQLRAVGVRNEDIVLVPAYRPDPHALRAPAGREAFTRHEIATASFEAHVLDAGLHGTPRGSLADLSAGGWRSVVGDARRRAAVHPHHERRKYLSPPGPTRMLLTFEGFGRYGRAARVRAETLAAGGFVPEPGRLDGGFLATRWIGNASPLPRVVEAGIAARMGEYLGCVAKRYGTGATAATGRLAEMLEVNVREALGDEAALVAASMSARAQGTDGPETLVDGRMLRHEWLLAEGRPIKTDALHHHDDHFYPGPCDPAWDVAAAILELGLGRAASDALLASYGEASHDRGIAWRLPFYAAAYAAFRLGYVTLAAETLGTTADGRRFARAAGRYRRHLAAALGGRGAQAYISPVSLTPSTSTPSS